MNTTPKEPNQSSQSTKSTNSKIASSVLFRLQEEAQAPFRKFRLFIYAASFLSATIGLFVSSSQLVSVLLGKSSAYPREETSYNILINVAVILFAATLYFLEYRTGKRRIDQLALPTTIRSLPIYYKGRECIIDDLKTKYRPILIAGNGTQVSTTIYQLKNISKELETRSFVVVPFVIDNDNSFQQIEGLEQNSWLALPCNNRQWKSWYEVENSSRPPNKKDEQVVVILRRDGKVGSRGYGTPMWTRLFRQIDEMSSK
eukprot:jgi/Galph1/6019/GphlegSOOS_G4672.1